MAKIESWVEGSRFYGLEALLKKLAIVHGLQIVTTSHKVLLSETVFYKVEGESENLRNFINDLQKLKIQ